MHEIEQRLRTLQPRHVASDVTAALIAIGGEVRRADLIRTAIERSGWSAEAEAVPATATDGPSPTTKPTRLGQVYDYAVSTLADRGTLVSAGGGRWRLAGAASIDPMTREGAVVLVTVGLHGEPVGEEYRVEMFDRIWLPRKPSTAFVRGDHAFVIGAGMGGAILGLYELLADEVSSDHPHRHDPERWPWSLPARPLASVPPSVAHRTGWHAPQSPPNTVRDAYRVQQLYAAVAGWEVVTPVGAASATGPARHVARLRESRLFRPGPAPKVQQFVQSALDEEERRALDERTRGRHQELLAALAARLTAAGWSAPEEIPCAIDLWSRAPSGESVVFEAKTLHEANELDQTRSGFAQLLEYRIVHGIPEDHLCLLCDAPLSASRGRVLEALDITVLVLTDGAWAASGAARACISSLVS